MMNKVCLALCSLLMTLNCFGQTVLRGKVVKVADGDTFTMLVDGNSQVRVRMYGIDAPEMTGGQPYCKASKYALSDMIYLKAVSVKVKDTDTYGRKIGVVSTDKVEDVNLEMLKSGMAWHYRHFDNTKSYADAEREAKNARRGLWQDAGAVNPYEWRKRNK